MLIGHAATIGAGEFVQASGGWVNDRTHCVQFRADFLRSVPPTTAEGIEKYLASSMIKGIGPIYARKPVRTFSEAVFDVIEQKPERLQEVDGIGPKRAESIVAAWADQKAIFLHSHDVGTSRAVRIFKTYGAATPFASSPRTRTGSRATSAASASKAPIRSPGNLASRRRR